MTMTEGVLKKYINNANVFIESGTHTGSTTQLAVDIGFEKIYTIELSEYFYNAARINFSNYQNVICIHGDSTEKLGYILDNLDEPAVFWLDGHWSMGDTAKGNLAVPIYEELKIIEKHKIKSHTILIDDLRLMGDTEELIKEWADISLEKTKEYLLVINKDYVFSFEDGHVSNDILVAQL